MADDDADGGLDADPKNDNQALRGEWWLRYCDLELACLENILEWEEKDMRRRNISDEDPYRRCHIDSPVMSAKVQDPVMVAHDRGVDHHYFQLGSEREAAFCVSFCMEFLDTDSPSLPPYYEDGRELATASFYAKWT